MNPIPVIAHDAKLSDEVGAIVSSGNPGVTAALLFKDPREAMEYLTVELPELVIINFSDQRVQPFELLDAIMKDPWLLNSGIVALYDEYEDLKKLEQIKGTNIIVTFQTTDVAKHIQKVLSVIERNRRILFQRGIGSDIVTNISGSFLLDNDPVEIQCYTNLICNFLYNSNKIDLEKKNNLMLALSELLLNAVEHGNCEISYQEKTDWLEQNRSIDDLIEIKCRNPLIAAKKVTFEYTIEPSCSRFSIADQGAGFDWRTMTDFTIRGNSLELHGRGIAMSRFVTQNLNYNEKGNEVTFEISYGAEVERMTPAIFHDMEIRDVQPGDEVLKEGEASNYMYYIVKGRYDVIVKDRTIASLSEDDIFMGELSFLLNDHIRTATVKAATAGKLITVTKKQFIEAVKKQPHYALFLSRLLAQRIQRLNQKATLQKVES
jgi:anti-sigma regulatory factor (Ser/Thr protein kinase)